MTLALAAGKVTDPAGNANLASTAADSTVTYDATAPSVAAVSSTIANGPYRAGAQIPITVTFSEPVTATGSPQLSLATGSPASTAVSYTSGSGGATLTFAYAVAAGNISPDLDYASTGALALNGGTIQDAAANNAVLTMAAPGAAGSLGAGKEIVIDTTAPTVTDAYDGLWHSGSVTFALEPTDGPGGSGVAHTYYKIGDATGFTEGTSVTVTGDASRSVEYYTTDLAGNESPHTTITVNVDTVTPKVTVSGSSGGWTKGPVTLTFSPAASPSGIAGVDYRVTRNDVRADWTPALRGANGYQATFSSDGTYTVDCRVTNGAGATSTASDASICSFAIDVTPPDVKLTSLNSASTGYNKPAFEFSASDAGGSQLSSGPIFKVDGEVVDATSDAALPDALSSGDHVVTVTATDAAGNETVQTCPINVTTPAFAVSPDSPNEGDIVCLCATDKGDTGNADGSQDDKTWLWSISRGNETPDTYEGPVGYIVPDTAADYHVQLTVTDTTTNSECIVSRTITVNPQAPRVHALNVDVLDGQSATLVGRFLDPGWTQTHTATFDVPGQDAIEGTVREDNTAALDSGYVSAVTPPLTGAGSTLTCYLTVRDTTEQSTKVSFKIHILPNDENSPSADEGSNGNDTISSSTPVLDGGQAHLSFIRSAGDVDIFEVKTPDDKPLPYGTEVLATLRDMAADYDLAIIQDLGSDVDTNKQNASFESSSFATSPNTHGPFEDYPNTHGPNTHGPNTARPQHPWAQHARSEHPWAQHARSLRGQPEHARTIPRLAQHPRPQHPRAVAQQSLSRLPQHPRPQHARPQHPWAVLRLAQHSRPQHPRPQHPRRVSAPAVPLDALHLRVTDDGQQPRRLLVLRPELDRSE